MAISLFPLLFSIGMHMCL